MKIVIATGIYPPQIGGPAQYAKSLAEEFSALDHEVKIVTYRFEKFLPMGVRHFWFFIKSLLALPGADFVLALDTFSVGLPVVVAAKILGKKIIIRTGGDFLWEGYVERTGNLVLLREFYDKIKARLITLNLKEKIIFRLTGWTLKHVNLVVFSTEWQRNIWRVPYGLNLDRTKIVENYYG